MPDQAVAAQAAMLCACRAHLQPLHLLRQNGSATAAGAAQAFAAAGTAAATAPSPAAALQAVREHVGAQITVLLDATADPGERAVLEGLNDALGTIPCANPLEELFAAVAERAGKLYEGLWPAVGFELTGMVAAPRRRPDDPYTLTASVDFSAGAPTVYLGVHSATFGPASFAAAARVLAHECVCHVAAQPAGSVDNHSAFSEGLMDWAAMQYLRLWMPYLPWVDGAAAMLHAEELGTISRGLQERHSGARSIGHYAAERLQSSVADLRDPAAGLAVADLAIELNQHPGPLAARTTWVTDLALGLRSPDEPIVQEALRGCRPAADTL